jgi:Mrp family chromosome partitioning ATPase
MSKNYELMREMERKQALLPAPSIGPSFTAADGSHRDLRRQWASDQMEGLVQRVFLQPGQASPNVVVFAAIDHGNGCSQIAATVARTLAAIGAGPVCLVEGNFRSPALPRMLGTTNYQGLTNALLEEGSIRSFMKPTGNGCLWLLSSGPLAADSHKLLAAERVRARIVELRAEFHFVIVDAPPLSQYADAIALGQLSDGMVMILEAGSTRRDAASTAVNSVRSARIQILGAVLNKGTVPSGVEILKTP